MEEKKQNKKRTKREPAVLRVNFITPDYDQEETTTEVVESSEKGERYHPDFDSIVFNEVVEAIEDTLYFPEDEVDLFELRGDCTFITLEKQYFPKVLVEALKYFEKKENYEMCAKCQDLLQTIKV